MATQYMAEIKLVSPGFLLGGTRCHVSSWFDSLDDAKSFAEQSVEVNKNRPGYADADIRFKIVGKTKVMGKSKFFEVK